MTLTPTSGGHAAQVVTHDTGGQVVDLVHRVCHLTGRPDLATADRCVRLAEDGGAPREVRARVRADLRAELGGTVGPTELDEALRTAALYDEVALLPTGQRTVLLDLLTGRATIGSVAARTGWTTGQVAQLARRAMRTLAATSA